MIQINSRKRICEATGKGHGRVRKGCRGGKPIGCSNVPRDSNRSSPGPFVVAGQNNERQSKSCHYFAPPKPKAAAGLRRVLDDFHVEHQMSSRDTEQRARELSRKIREDFGLRESAADRECRSHQRIEMRSGPRPEGYDKCRQSKAGCQGISEEHDGIVSLREALAHDARPHDARKEKRRAYAVSNSAARDLHAVVS